MYPMICWANFGDMMRAEWLVLWVGLVVWFGMVLKAGYWPAWIIILVLAFTVLGLPFWGLVSYRLRKEGHPYLFKSWISFYWRRGFAFRI
jgi:hypothetical protein